MTGRVLTRVGLAAALWVVGVSASGALLSGLGWWLPWVAWPVGAAVAVGSGWAVRRLPGVGLAPAAGVGLVAVVLALTAWVGATHSEQVLPRRDAASNLQATVALARTGERVVAVDPATVGGAAVLATPGVTLGSPAFYEVGTDAEPAVQPQFVVAPAVVGSYAWWLGGAGAVFLVPALASGLALLCLGLLVARVVGPWWGVVAAGATGLVFPLVHTARATYSEPLAMLTLVGGFLALTLVAGRGPGAGGWDDRRDRMTALLAGVLVGGTGLARIDALREVVLLVPALVVLAVLGVRWLRPLLVGLLGSLAVAGAAALALSNRYLGDIAASLLPLVALAALFAVLGWGVVVGWRRGVRLPAPVVRRLPDVLGALVVVAGLGLASRPLWQTVRQDPNDPGARYVAGMQARQGLAVDGGRTYAEQSVQWLAWWVGPVALAVALLALALLVRRAVRALGEGRLEPWLPVLLVAAGSTLLTLQRPGITPDHPWAERRLVIALPFVVVLVVAAAAWLARRSASGRAGLWHTASGVVVLALLAPVALATWPHRAGGVERGSLAAVEQVCAALRPGDTVLAVDSRGANEWPQVVRGTCGVPALALTGAARRDAATLTATVDRVRLGVEGEGRRLVLLAADSDAALRTLGVAPRQVADVVVREDEHALEHRPDGTDPLPVTIWLGADG